jgi:thymidylate synthase
MIPAFPSLDQAWQNALGNVLDYGLSVTSRNGGSKELIGYAFVVEDPRRRVLTNARRKMTRAYAAAETLWYLSRETDVERLLAYAPQYARFADANRQAHGAYGGRWARNADKDQVDSALEILSTHENSRQCVVSMWRPHDLDVALTKECKDVPCTLNMQFFKRDDSLHLQVTMRSNDLWLGTPYDCFAFMTVQHLMANALELQLGTYTHVVGSIHVYDKDIEKAAMAEKAEFPYGFIDSDLEPEDARDALLTGGTYAYDELLCRKRSPMRFGALPSDNYMEDLVVACLRKLGVEDRLPLHQCMQEAA